MEINGKYEKQFGGVIFITDFLCFQNFDNNIYKPNNIYFFYFKN